MSEHGLHKTLMSAVVAAALLATAPAPATAGNCASLSANFALCADGTPWSGARWIAFGDGAALEMGAYYVEFAEHWAGRSDEATLDAALDALLAEMSALEIEDGMAPPETLLRDSFETGPLQVVRAVQSVDMGDDKPMLMATMIAESDGARIVVMFGEDDAMPLGELTEAARAFVTLIRPAQEG